jgi:hypothetical protein
MRTGSDDRLFVVEKAVWFWLGTSGKWLVHQDRRLPQAILRRASLLLKNCEGSALR